MDGLGCYVGVGLGLVYCFGGVIRVGVGCLLERLVFWGVGCDLGLGGWFGGFGCPVRLCH